MPMIEVRHLLLIKTITEIGNLTKAAQKLCLTQPALSHQLQDIEDKLNTPLFIRTKRQMIPTPAGERMLQSARTVLDEIRLLELDIGKLIHGETGSLRIGTTCLLSYQWLPGVMKRFQVLFPKVSVELLTPPDYFQALRDRQLNLIITSIKDEKQDIHYVPLFRDEILVIMPPREPISIKPFLEIQDLADLTLLVSRDTVKGDLYEYYLAPAGIRVAKVIKAEHPQAVIELVKSGFGVSLLPRWSVASYLKSGEIHGRSLTKKGMYMTWEAASLSAAEPSAFQQEFINLIIDRRVADN
ncbi:MAG: hypothetical protein C0403_08030 [Desulfobacterium sp.]|nr:hypothetical protein [Desulfobacterium sp.]